MKLYFFNTILGILAFIVLILPFTGKVHDSRRKWLKGFTIRGWVVCVAFIASIVVNYLKDLQGDINDAQKIQVVKNEKKQDSAIARKNTDESNAKIITTFTTALAKYGLKYDSSQKVIKKLVLDSSKKIYYNEVKPDIDFNETKLIEYKNDSLKFSFKLICKDAAAEHVYLKSQTMFVEHGRYVKLSPDTMFFPSNIKLSKNSVYLIKRPVVVNLKKIDFEKIYFYMTGSYIFNKITYPVEQLIFYDIQTSECGIPGNKNQIMSLFLKK